MSGRNDPTPPSANNGANPSNSAVAKCPDDPCGKDAISNVTKCCGSEIFDEAKKANGDKDPEIVFGAPSSGFDAETDTSTGTITVNKKSDKCTATESVFFELANLSSKPNFDKIDADANAGNLSREEYAKASEKEEYNNVKKTHEAIDKCKRKSGAANPMRLIWMVSVQRKILMITTITMSSTPTKITIALLDSDYKKAYNAKHPSPPKK